MSCWKKLELNCRRKREKLELKKELNDNDDSLSAERNGSDLMIEEMEISEKIQRKNRTSIESTRLLVHRFLPRSLSLTLSLSLSLGSTFDLFLSPSSLQVMFM